MKYSTPLKQTLTDLRNFPNIIHKPLPDECDKIIFKDEASGLWVYGKKAEKKKKKKG